MARRCLIATLLLLASAAVSQAQLMGPTGTMYDGNNAKLALPQAGNAAGSSADQGKGNGSKNPFGNATPLAATGASAAGASSGGEKTGGDH